LGDKFNRVAELLPIQLVACVSHFILLGLLESNVTLQSCVSEEDDLHLTFDKRVLWTVNPVSWYPGFLLLRSVL